MRFIAIRWYLSADQTIIEQERKIESLEKDLQEISEKNTQIVSLGSRCKGLEDVKKALLKKIYWLFYSADDWDSQKADLYFDPREEGSERQLWQTQRPL